MKPSMQGLAAAVLVTAAFFVGRWSSHAPPTSDPAATNVATRDTVDSDADARSAASSTEGPVANAPFAVRPDAARTAPTMPTPPGTPSLPDVPVSSQATGPQPLTPEDEAALVRAEAVMRAEGGTASDLLELAKKEKQDAQARQLEALITQSILQHGGGYVALRLAPPRCTRSVCIVRGISAGGTQDPRADWQRLSGVVMNEPWFPEAFDDMSGMVTGDGPNTVYITLYVRCALGSCRFGRQ